MLNFIEFRQSKDSPKSEDLIQNKCDLNDYFEHEDLGFEGLRDCLLLRFLLFRNLQVSKSEVSARVNINF